MARGATSVSLFPPHAKALCVALLLLASSVWYSQPASAQLADPIDLMEEVTASVPYLAAPPVPILRRPSNKDITSEKRVEFRWEAVTTHPLTLTHYELVLNGSTLFDNIYLYEHETEEYSLTLLDGVYRLRLKPEADLDDGEYTWKIRVVDIRDSKTSSTTWQFTVDTSSPPIIVTDIQGEPHSISASDPQTIPSSPIIVNVPQPYVYGTTEELVEVQLIVTRGDGSLASFKMTATDDGHFLFTLPHLNAQEIVTLNFTAIDKAGNTRALSGLRIQYQPKTFVIPLPDFFPGQPEIVIPVPDVPDIFIPNSPTATPPAKPDTTAPLVPAPQVYERPVTYIGYWRIALVFLLLGYTVLIFILTGNSWWLYPWWLPRWVKWLLLLPEGDDKATNSDNVGIPWVALAFEWLASEGKLRRRWVWTSVRGNFPYPQRFDSVQTLRVEHPGWSWVPIPTGHVVAGGYVGLQTDIQSRVARSHQVHTVVTKQKWVWIWLQRVGRSEWRWKLRFVPRIWLLGMILVAAWLAWLVPIRESFGWLAVTVAILLRDVQSRVPSRWQVWSSQPGRSQ